MVQIREQTLSSQEAGSTRKAYVIKGWIVWVRTGEVDRLKKNTAVNIYHPVSPYS